MLVVLDGPSRLVFSRPRAVLTAATPEQAEAALATAQAALAAGRHVAGWLGYALGHALEPRLQGLQQPGMPLLQLGVFDGPDGTAPLPQGRAYAGPLRPEWDAAAYADRFARVKALIGAGDIYQANLSFRAPFAFAGDALALYEQLRGASGAAHCGYVDFFDEKSGSAHQVLSLSPELFFDLAADGRITVKPMKGTIARAGDDAAERAALAASVKDRAENLMIVDLIRNDLSRIAEGGSVTVPDLFAIETYPSLHTMVSTVTARKRADAGLRDVLRALFPCGSVTGAPKIRAMEALHDLETSPRGVYCGAVGYFAPAPHNQFSARFNVAIRTLTISGDRGELGVGGGVVQDSRAEAEYAECLVKARFFIDARRPLDLIETLKWEGGFVRLDAHLARMAASAQVFGLPFNAAQARCAMEAAIADRAGPQRVRLTLDEAGMHRATATPLESNLPFWRYAVSPKTVQSGDLLLRHKTSWRDLYEEEAVRLSADEVLFVNERGELTEGARSTIFVARGDKLLTPPLAAGLLPGILRAELIATGKAREARLTPDDLKGEVWLGNSLRGLIPARSV